MPAVVPKLSETPGEIRWTGRPLGADTDAVLTEVLGMSPEQVEKLRGQGVLGHAPDAAKEGSR
jgi:crotonobetainyl-CoA:carnitine CoA-transferase CaiB-like acyl-CoA transferase